MAIDPDKHEALPPELRGGDSGPSHPRTGPPVWTRVVAVLLVISLIGFYVISAFG